MTATMLDPITGTRKQKGAGPRRKDPTRCRNGHDIADPDNIYIDPSGRELCRGCKRDASRRRRERIARGESAKVAAPPQPEPFIDADGMLDRLVAEESAMPWDRIERRAKRLQHDMIRRAALANGEIRLRGDDSTG